MYTSNKSKYLAEEEEVSVKISPADDALIGVPVSFNQKQ
jgi:hypothetical protein